MEQKFIHRFIHFFGFVLFLGFLDIVYAAEKYPAPPFPIGTSTIEKIEQKHIYYYRQKAYKPAVKVQYSDKETGGRSTPEATLISLLSAMRSGNFDWHRSLWDAESQKFMNENDIKKGFDDKRWVGVWGKLFSSREAYITHRIEMGGFVLLAYEMRPIKNVTHDGVQQKPVMLTMAFVDTPDGWLATQALSGDPVKSYWQRKNAIPEVTDRTID
jgi:hypothetical protein